MFTNLKDGDNKDRCLKASMTGRVWWWWHR